MKIRNGFVSNSSSSSFIVAVTNPETTTVAVTVKANLKNFTRDVIKTEIELLKYFNSQYGSEWLEEEYLLDRFNKCKQKLAAGWVICCGVFSDEEGAIERILCEEGIQEQEGIKVILSEGGY